MNDPVLVLGMHRSGTTLIARTLARLGVFMGADLDPNHEANAFQALNQFVLAQAGARWDHPEPAEALLERAELRDLFRGHLDRMVHSPYMRRFTGTRLGRCAALEGLGPWGWKDPRTLLLLPIWLEVFPSARLIHVRRHGVDVAASLRARHVEVLAHTFDLRERNELFSYKEPFRAFIDTVRAGTIEGAFGLWEHYMAVAQRRMDGLDVLDLGYEDFVMNPVDGFRRIAAYVGVDPPPHALDDTATSIDVTRVFPFRRDPELLAFAATVSDRLRRYGYGAEAESEAGA